MLASHFFEDFCSLVPYSIFLLRIKASAFFNVFFLITCRYLLIYLLVVGGVGLRLESLYTYFCWCIYIGIMQQECPFLHIWQEPGWSTPPGCGPRRADPAPVRQVLGSTPTNWRVWPSCRAKRCNCWCRKQGRWLLLLASEWWWRVGAGREGVVPPHQPGGLGEASLISTKAHVNKAKALPSEDR